MSSSLPIVYLLTQNAPVTAVVPANQIMAGGIPQGTPFPNLSVVELNSIPMNFIRILESPRFETARIQLTARFKGSRGTPPGTGFPGAKGLLELALRACVGNRGTINGVIVDSITPDIAGPDLHDEIADIYVQSRDIIVRWKSSW